MTDDPEVLLGRLHDDLRRGVSGAPASTVPDQVERLYGVVAGEVRADAPLPDLARTAGMELITISSRWGATAGDVRTTVGYLLAWVDRQAEAGATVAPQPPPVRPGSAAEAAAPAEATAIDMGADEIGGPIIPDD